MSPTGKPQMQFFRCISIRKVRLTKADLLPLSLVSQQTLEWEALVRDLLLSLKNDPLGTPSNS